MTVDVGAEAPDFELRDQHGRPVRLSDFRDSKKVVLVFFPFAFTSVCTGEMCALRDDLPSFQNDDVQVLAVSCDTVFAQPVYAEREGLQFPVLSDFWPHGAVASTYGALEGAHGARPRTGKPSSSLCCRTSGRTARWRARTASSTMLTAVLFAGPSSSTGRASCAGRAWTPSPLG